MKKLNILFLIVISLFSYLSAEAEVKKLKIAFGANKPPFMFKLGTNAGLEYDIIKEVFALKGYNIEPLQLTYKKLSTALIDDLTIDGSAGVQKQVNDPFYYSNNYIHFKNHAYTKKIDNIKLNSFKDLKGKRIAIWGDGHKHLGDNFFELFNPKARQIHTPNFYEINNQKEQVSSLFNGISNVVIIDKTIFHWYKNELTENINTDIEIIEDNLFDNTTGFNITFRDKKLNEIFNDGLQQLKTSGRYEEILNNYADSNLQFFMKYTNLLSNIIKSLILEDDTKAIKVIVDEFTKTIPAIETLEVKDRFNKRIALYTNSKQLDINTKNKIKQKIDNFSSTKGFISALGEIKLTFYNKQSKQSLPDIIDIVNKTKKLTNLQKRNIINSYEISLNNNLDQNNNNKFTFTKAQKDWIKNNKIVKISMINDYMPFSFVKEGKHQGFSVELLKKISNISGLKFDIQTSKWNYALKNFKNNKVDMISEISYTKERESFTYFTKPYYEISTYVFGLDKNKYVNNDSLIGAKVAITKNVFYKNDLKKLGINIVEYESSSLKVKALKDGEVDYFLDSYTAGKESIEENSFHNIKALDPYSRIKKEDLRYIKTIKSFMI